MERDTHAFVIWLDGDPADAGVAGLRGRVEHVQTSARASFASADELLRFLPGHRAQAAGAEPER